MGLLILGIALVIMGTVGIVLARPRKTDYTKDLENLLEALEYKPGLTGLQQGAKLEVEQLDLQGLGLYTDEQKTKLIQEGIPREDFFLTSFFHSVGWARKSEQGIKWHTYLDSEIKLHKKLP